MACPNIKRRRTFAMACTCGPCTAARTASRLRGASASAGYQVCAWLVEPDELAVESVLMGHRMQLAAADRLEVVRIATARGESATQIATRLRVSPRTVVRYRGRLA